MSHCGFCGTRDDRVVLHRGASTGFLTRACSVQCARDAHALFRREQEIAGDLKTLNLYNEGWPGAPGSPYEYFPVRAVYESGRSRWIYVWVPYNDPEAGIGIAASEPFDENYLPQGWGVSTTLLVPRNPAQRAKYEREFRKGSTGMEVALRPQDPNNDPLAGLLVDRPKTLPDSRTVSVVKLADRAEYVFAPPRMRLPWQAIRSGVDEDNKWTAELEQRKALVKHDAGMVLRAELKAVMSATIQVVLQMLIQAQSNRDQLVTHRSMILQTMELSTMLNDIRELVDSLPENKTVGDQIVRGDYIAELERLYDSMLQLEREVDHWRPSQDELTTVGRQLAAFSRRIALLYDSQKVYKESLNPGSYLGTLPRDVKTMLAQYTADESNDADVLQRNNIRGK